MKKMFFTLTFTLFNLIFYAAAFYVLRRLAPGMLDAIEKEITGEHLMILIGIFAAILVFSYFGAGLIVNGRTGGSEE